MGARGYIVLVRAPASALRHTPLARPPFLALHPPHPRRPAHLVVALLALLAREVADVLLRHLLQLALLCLRRPLAQLLLGLDRLEPPPLQVAARVEVVGDLAVAPLAAQQRAEAALAAGEAQQQVERRAGRRAASAAAAQRAAASDEQLLGGRDAGARLGGRRGGGAAGGGAWGKCPCERERRGAVRGCLPPGRLWPAVRATRKHAAAAPAAAWRRGAAAACGGGAAARRRGGAAARRRAHLERALQRVDAGAALR
jgi:hypothetical protein